ncbi:MAG: ABC transporter permease subunit [Candidatus Baltobacteraceae bacterium]
MDPGYGGQLLQGAGVTLEVAFTTLFFGLAFGLLGAAAKLSKAAWLRVPVMTVTSLLRGVPEFVILLICYFELGNILQGLTGGRVSIDPFTGGVVALSIVLAAYSSETFRGAFLSVPPGQLEAARAFGMQPQQVFFRIHLPQAMRFALPSLSNLWQNLLKDSALVSVLGLEELMQKASIAAQVTKQPFVYFLAAAFIYLIFLAISNVVFARLERRAARGVAAS